MVIKSITHISGDLSIIFFKINEHITVQCGIYLACFCKEVDLPLVHNREAHMQNRNVFIMIAVGILLILVIPGLIFAAGKATKTGMLTAIEEDGTIVIIDKIGYTLSPSSTIQNYKGDRALLKDFTLPLYVYFEYEYTRTGFSIILIKERPQ